MRDFGLFTVIVMAGTGGELCVSRAMKSVGEATSFRPAEVVRVVRGAFRQPWMWVGIFMMALAFFALLFALNHLNLSLAAPAAASLTLVTNAVAAKLFLKENVDRRRWTAALLVCVGVYLLAH